MTDWTDNERSELSRMLDERNDTIAREVEAIKSFRETRSGQIQHDTRRVLIRSARIVCGLVVATIGWIVLSASPEIASVPFARLTVGMFASGLFGSAGGMALVFWGIFGIAFGAGPSWKEVESEIKSEATRRVDSRARHPS